MGGGRYDSYEGKVEPGEVCNQERLADSVDSISKDAKRGEGSGWGRVGWGNSVFILLYKRHRSQPRVERKRK